jgi:plasmid stabilization system protein ParE
VDYQIFFTEPALEDLDSIMTRALIDHESSAGRFATALLNHVDLLSQFPYLGVPIRSLPGVRRMLMRHFTSTTLSTRTGDASKSIISGTFGGVRLR